MADQLDTQEENRPTSESITAGPPAPSELAPAMDADGYRTSPDQETTAWPPGIPYIIGNEACERFSYYGMHAILYVHLASLYAGVAGMADQAAKDMATSTTHLFHAGVYTLPMIGAILADRLIGKYRTILYLSLVYCAGHAVLAVGEGSLQGMYLGLGLIAVGSGGIKPCVSANVGDQFGKGNWFRVRTVYQIFYFSINFGSFFSTLLIPFVKEYIGTSVAFGIPGVLMLIATLFFWLGRHKYVHVPPKPGGRIGLYDTLSSVLLFMMIGHLFITPSFFNGLMTPGLVWIALAATSLVFLVLGLWVFSIRQRLQPDDGFLAITFYTLRRFLSGRNEDDTRPAEDADWLERSRFWGPAVARFGREAVEGPVAVFKIISVFFLISVFWALFDQHSTSWIRQAAMMDLSLWGDQKALPTQVPALNPLMVMVLIPVMNLIYILFERAGIRTTPLRRITVGMAIAAVSFVVVALLQQRIEAAGDGQVWFLWQVIPYLLITIAEVMVSITGLEFAYTQAPKRMKSTIMGFWLLTVALGNVIVAFLAGFGKLPLVDFFWIFAGLSGAAAVLFGIRGLFYVQKDYTQE